MTLTPIAWRVVEDFAGQEGLGNQSVSLEQIIRQHAALRGVDLAEVRERLQKQPPVEYATTQRKGGERPISTKRPVGAETIRDGRTGDRPKEVGRK